MSLEQQWKMMDYFKRKMFVRYEAKRWLLKSIIYNISIRPIIRIYAIYKLSLIPFSSAITKQNNRCVVSGRTYNVLRQFKLSRFQVRDLANSGSLPGFRKYSW